MVTAILKVVHMKATATAHPIQGLIKYHGLKKPRQRIPYHDSISVCIQALTTTTTVEASRSSGKNVIIINGEKQRGRDMERAEAVLDKLKKLAGFSGNFKVVSENSLKVGKGLGFSASGFAALGLAASQALGLSLDTISLSETVRLGAGSATRSLAGRFAIWYADKNGNSYAEQLDAPGTIDLSMVIVPVHSDVKTDEAHAEVLSSPLFRARLKNVRGLLETMKNAIRSGDVATIGRLAEEDTLNLHAITMTGKSHMVLWEPDTLRVIREVVRMRKEGIPAWYSIDTGPSVFINTYKENAGVVAKRLHEIGFKNAIVSGVGGKPFLANKHLF
ncbi:MAG: diphosphomevalonate decarboxylase [Candidatus Bathyarchaeia archaeon]